MKSIFLYITIFFVGCNPLTNTKLLKFPPDDFSLDNKLLKTNGYYYCEKQWTRYCRRFPSNYTVDSLSKYDEKYISAFFLYIDGYAYSTGSLITAGLNRPNIYNSNDYCDKLIQFNTFESARQVFEKHLSENRIGANSSQDKGVFKIKNDTIHFQIYESGSQSLILTEYSGKILNDSTFKIFKESSHLNTIPKNKPLVKNLQDIYHFKRHSIKADSTNYYRDNRLKLNK